MKGKRSSPVKQIPGEEAARAALEDGRHGKGGFEGWRLRTGVWPCPCPFLPGEVPPMLQRSSGMELSPRGERDQPRPPLPSAFPRARWAGEGGREGGSDGGWSRIAGMARIHFFPFFSRRPLPKTRFDRCACPSDTKAGAFPNKSFRGNTVRLGKLPLLSVGSSFPKETLDTSFCCKGHTERQNNPLEDGLYPIPFRIWAEDETPAPDWNLCL